MRLIGTYFIYKFHCILIVYLYNRNSCIILTNNTNIKKYTYLNVIIVF